MIVVKGQKYQVIKTEDLKPGDSITVVDNQGWNSTYSQAQVAELMNKAYDVGYAKCRTDMRDDD